MRICGLEPQAEAFTDVFPSAFASFVSATGRGVTGTSFDPNEDVVPAGIPAASAIPFAATKSWKDVLLYQLSYGPPLKVMDPAGLEPATRCSPSGIRRDCLLKGRGDKEWRDTVLKLHSNGGVRTRISRLPRRFTRRTFFAGCSPTGIRHGS